MSGAKRPLRKPTHAAQPTLPQEETMKNTWGSRIMIIPLVGGFLLASSGFGVTMVVAAPPATQSDLQGVTQNWDKNLPSASRFTILKDFNSKAVRDNNTGLVWEQSPDTTTRDWLHARLDCLNKNVGGTTGWRLPSVIELKSVRDPSLAAPFVPASVFTGIQLDEYWSATTDAVHPDFKTFLNHFWCVRGPMNADQY